MNFNVNLGGLVFNIDSLYDVKSLYCDYITDKKADYFIATDKESIDFEINSCKYKINAIEAEKQIVYRKIWHCLLDNSAFILHASVVAVDEKAYAFAAPSGTGKSTHTNLWLERFGDRAFIVNGDKPIIRLINGIFYAFGSPYSGKENLNTNATVPLQGICFLARGNDNRITKATPSRCVEGMLSSVPFPENTELTVKAMHTIEQLINSIAMYDFECNISQEAVEMAYNTLSGGKL